MSKRARRKKRAGLGLAKPRTEEDYRAASSRMLQSMQEKYAPIRAQMMEKYPHLFEESQPQESSEPMTAEASE